MISIKLAYFQMHASVMADCGFENKQNGKRYTKTPPPLLAILPEGPQQKFLEN
jgi:hypothetical protein